MRDAFTRTIYQLAKEDPNVFIVVADISPAASMAPFQKEFPDRFINIGVAEQSMIGMCAGMAMRGLKVFAYTIATFAAYRPFEQIRDDLCYQNIPVTVVGVGGGVAYSSLGGTHHAQEDIAIMSALPNMSVMAPCDPLETEAATLACSRLRTPAYLRLGKSGEPILTANASEPFEFGKSRYLKKGNGTCILSYGPIMKMAFEVAEKMERMQKTVSIISIHTLKPLDRGGIAKALKTYSEVIVIEEHSERGGLAVQVKQIAWEEKASCRLLTFSLEDKFIHTYGSQQDIWKAHGLSRDDIFYEISTAKRRVRWLKSIS